MAQTTFTNGSTLLTARTVINDNATDAESRMTTNTTNIAGKVSSDPTGVTGADAVTNIMSLTQSEYDAIGTPDASTFYIITDA